MKKHAILVTVLVLAVGVASFVTGGWFFTMKVLDDYNGMASANYSIALASFRDDYQSKRIRIFGELEEKSTFVIDDYEFVVIPTSSHPSGDSLNPEHANMASHLNGMVVMLASTWSINGDSRGEELMSKLKQIIPDFMLSSPKTKTVALRDLEKGSEMMRAEASQWSGRMKDLAETPKATPKTQSGAEKPAAAAEL